MIGDIVKVIRGFYHLNKTGIVVGIEDSNFCKVLIEGTVFEFNKYCLCKINDY